MKIRDDWKAILTKAWSIRFIVIAGVLETIGAGLQALVDNGAASVTLHILAAASLAAAGVARVVAQKNLPDGGA